MNLILLLFILNCKVCMFLCESNCMNFKTCGDCMGYPDDRCVWCPASGDVEHRCRPKILVHNDRTWCSEEVYDPDIKQNTLWDDHFNKGENGSKVIQFKPQLVKIKARPGIPVAIEMSYKPAKDYPLDIYYLMDYSETMKEHVDTLKNQGSSIPIGLANITNNVKLGIGSFIEKPSMPFVDSTKYNNVYSFKHHLSLTDNMTNFANALADPKFGINYDPPEAGLDALMQAMRCMEDLDWRENARRIIVLSTDSTYHSAGDGKFVGAYVRNDMSCHLKNGLYEKELIFDYPSISQINKVATENNFMIIFAAMPSVKSHYQALEQSIKGSKYVELGTNSTLVDIIRNEYLGLLRNMVLESNTPNFMRFDFNPDCSKADQCVLKHNEEFNFTGILTVESCPPDKNYSYKIAVGPRLLNEKLIIEVEVDCQCDCEKPDKGEPNSPKCNSVGTYQCGVCKCNENRSGNTCQCSGTESNNKDVDKCKQIEDTYLCSGHGTCRCGNCKCTPGYFGVYCQYNNMDCPSPGGVICAGHGSCEFGQCTCEDGWLPDNCLCPSNNDSCIAPLSKEICSGNGKCDCGNCKCNIGDNGKGKCDGQFCDNCEDVIANRCNEFEDYAYCNVKNDKAYCDEQFDQKDTEVIFVNKTEMNSDKWYEAKVWCSKIFEDNTKLVFRYHYRNKGRNTFLRIIIQNELEEQNAANIFITIGSVIGGVLLIGLITLIVWKFLVDLHDKREYTRFYEESKALGYDVSNPFYESPNANFINPAYNPNR